jgi:hypothetical protein
MTESADMELNDTAYLEDQDSDGSNGYGYT